MLFGALPAIGPMEVLILLATGVFYVWPACRICSKAGFPWPLGLLALIPGINLVLLCVLAFVEWPIHRSKNSISE